MPTVAVIDTGVDPSRIDPARIVPGINLSLDGATADTSDPHGHGTAIAAAILASSAAAVLPVKLIGDRGYLREDGQLEVAFEWILEHHASSGIQVVCASFADASHAVTDERHRDSLLRQRIAALRHAGVAVVAPAGNGYAMNRLHNPQGMAWPAILREVVSVGALLAGTDKLSNHTQRLHQSLGTGCHTTLFAEPGSLSGTSGAAAVVAGRLADLRDSHTAADVTELVARLLRDGAVACDDSDLLWPALIAKPVQTSPAPP